MNASLVSILAAGTLLFAGCGLFGRSHHDPPAAAASPAGSETRYWDPQRNQWGTRTAQDSSASPEAAPGTGERPTAPAAPPASTPRPSRATGVYNSSTGKIEWQAGEGPAPAPAPTPEPTKHWWWPF